MKALSKLGGIRAILEQKAVELTHVLQHREGITIEKSADQMDEIQYATERDLAIRNVDRESSLLRQVEAALGRIHAGRFGNCIDCEETIKPKRITAVPWATRCIECQELHDRKSRDSAGVSEDLVTVA